MSQKNLAHLFNKFAGKEVQATEIVNQTKYGPMSHVKILPSDTVVSELKQAVEDMGLKLRLWVPGTGGTDDYRTDRLNAHLKKGADGKYRIGSNFDIG